MAFRFKAPGVAAAAAMAANPATWTREDVERWLTDFPLPANFTFNGARVWPRYQLRCGYGQWLRTAGPYHVALRGLFSLVCEILISWPVGQVMPTPEELAEKISDHMAAQGELMLTPEDTAKPAAPNHPGERDDEPDAEAARDEREKEHGYTPPPPEY